MKKSVVFSIVIAVVLTIGVIALAMSNLTTGNPDASDVSAESAATTQGDSLTDEDCTIDASKVRVYQH